MGTFTVTYDIVTPESAEDGDAAERGLIVEAASLHDAVAALFETRTSLVDGVECIETDEWPMREPRWVQVTNGREFETGASETRALHMPDSLTRSTRVRIARLLGAR